MPPSDLNIRRRNLSLRAERIEWRLGLNRPFTKRDVYEVDTELKRLVDEWKTIKSNMLDELQKEDP